MMLVHFINEHVGAILMTITVSIFFIVILKDNGGYHDE